MAADALTVSSGSNNPTNLGESISMPLYHRVVAGIDGESASCTTSTATATTSKKMTSLQFSNDDATSDRALSAPFSYTSNTGFRKASMILLVMSTIMLYADQNLMAPNLTKIAEFFGFNEEERDKKLGGQIAFGFWFLGAPASFVIGALGDRYNRAKLFAATVAVGGVACLLTCLVRTYPQLFVARVLTGLAIGGNMPLLFSVLADLHPAEERHKVNALVSMAMGLGVILGQSVAGFVGPTLGWRAPFGIIGLPALFVAAAVWLYVEDPPRGSMEEAFRQCDNNNAAEDNALINDNDKEENDSPPAPEALVVLTPVEQNPQSAGDYWRIFVSLISTPTVALILVQGIPGCIPWGIIYTYLTDFFAQNRGISVEKATSYTLVFGVSFWIGTLISGATGGSLYRRDKRLPALLSGVTTIFGCLPFYGVLNYISKDSPLAINIFLIMSSGISITIAGPIIKATLQNVTLPQRRGQAFAFYNIFDDLGRGLGPVVVAELIAVMGGRLPAFNIAVLGWAICGVLNLLVFFTVTTDEDKVQAQIAAILHQRVTADDDDHDLNATLDPSHAIS